VFQPRALLMGDVLILPDFPPNIAAIRAVFPLTGDEIFAYDNVIYNPSNQRLPESLIEHEKVHFKQHEKIGGSKDWWDLYLVDEDFRLEQELAAHRKEYQVICRTVRGKRERYRFLDLLAKRLSAPMYGRVVTYQWAMVQIKRRH